MYYILEIAIFCHTLVDTNVSCIFLLKMRRVVLNRPFLIKLLPFQIFCFINNVVNNDDLLITKKKNIHIWIFMCFLHFSMLFIGIMPWEHDFMCSTVGSFHLNCQQHKKIKHMVHIFLNYSDSQEAILNRLILERILYFYFYWFTCFLMFFIHYFHSLRASFTKIPNTDH